MIKRKCSQSPYYILDAFSSEDIERWEIQKEKILRYYWDLYSDFAYERHKIADQLRAALLEATSIYEFKGWQRQVRYKYSLSPLSPRGSLIEPGGRFNIPDVNPEQIPPFPALYIAENKETVLQEAGQSGKGSGPLAALDLALTKPDSISIVAVRGKLGSVIDLHDLKRLKPFLKLIKGISASKKTIEAVKGLKLPLPLAVRTLSDLKNSLLEPNWRAMCMQFDIPANSQIFGQLVANAGIEGIIYPSKFSQKKCLAIYPQNFDGESFIALKDDAPEGAVTRLDFSNPH
jgi:RES domain-containing protein